MARPKKEKVIETKEVDIVEQTIQPIEPIVEDTKTEMVVTNEVVEPIVVNTNRFIQGDKVKLINSETNRVIAMAVERKLADKLVSENGKLKIVQ